VEVVDSKSSYVEIGEPHENTILNMAEVKEIEPTSISPLVSNRHPLITPCLNLTCDSEDVIAKIKGLDRKIPGREIPSDDEDDNDAEEDKSPPTPSSSPATNPIHLKIEIIESDVGGGCSPAKSILSGSPSLRISPILRRSVTTDVYSPGGSATEACEITCGKCGGTSLLGVSQCGGSVLEALPPTNTLSAAYRRASSYNRRTVSFSDDVGEISVPTDLTPATDSSSNSGSASDASEDEEGYSSNRCLHPDANFRNQCRRSRSVEVLVSPREVQPPISSGAAADPEKEIAK